jgi:glycosyltransferase involved in cell wall biosynthesis
MKVLHIVTFISPDGTYGGPVRVSFNQARALQAFGADVLIAGAGRGYDPVPRELEGLPVQLTKPVQLLPFMGFAGLASPALLWWMVRRRSAYEVAHIHLARDLVTLPAALLALVLGKRVVVQTHGMIIESRRLIAPILDFVLTRPVLRRAHAVFYLSEDERRAISRVEPNLALVHLPNGVPVDDDAPRSADGSGDGRTRVEVLYLARLHERKRPRLFVDAAAELLRAGVDADFRLVGPDGGEGGGVIRDLAQINNPAISYEGALPPADTGQRMTRASIYVLPSINEPFPMSVLEAMANGLPVVVTRSCGLADVITRTGSGIVVDEDRHSLVEAMRRLIEHAELRRQMGAAARATAVSTYSMAAVCQRLVSEYRSPTGSPL